jgi:nitrate/TMAO reductase-like tetraheme cytochrome c subunit
MRVPLKLIIAASALFGAAAGLGAFTFVYAKGNSYLTNDPAACANCHVMTETVRGLDEGFAPRRGHLQRLPHARPTSSAST